MGVDLDEFLVKVLIWRFPHTRGGGPPQCVCYSGSRSFSPHAWGWTCYSQKARGYRRVFPTRVGVDRSRPPRDNWVTSFSPHAWGWTVTRRFLCRRQVVFPTRVGVDRLTFGVLRRLESVFPTRVGVDRASAHLNCTPEGFPHTRGGGPWCWGGYISE